MLRSLKDLKEYSIGATDGVIGQVNDLYFDDAKWAVRYVVIETGEWLASRKILMVPFSVKGLDAPKKTLTVSITRTQVWQSPEIDTDKPVSRQHEMRLLDYTRYPKYWESSGLAGQGSYPPAVFSSLGFHGTSLECRRTSIELARLGALEQSKRHAYDDAHLRSCSALLNCPVHATDGDVGHVQDFLVDETTWAIAYVVIDTGHWWKGHPVLVEPRWILPSLGTVLRLAVNRTRAFLQEAPSHSMASA